MRHPGDQCGPSGIARAEWYNTFVDFLDGAPGDTLKIDNPGSFGAAVRGFQAGDTIDLGHIGPIATIAYAAMPGFLALENAAGTTVATLLLGNSVANSGTFAVPSTGTVDGFVLKANAAGETLLESLATIVSLGAPVLSTGASVTVPKGVTSTVTAAATERGLSILGGGTLNVAHNLTIALNDNGASFPATLANYGGLLSVGRGATLSAGGLQQIEPGASTTIAAGATVALTGELNPSAPANGLWGIQNGNSWAVSFSSGTASISGALLAGPVFTVWQGRIGRRLRCDRLRQQYLGFRNSQSRRHGHGNPSGALCGSDLGRHADAGRAG
jgi:hypothetical protein